MSQIILNSPEVVENESEPGVRLEINNLESEKDLEQSYNNYSEDLNEPIDEDNKSLSPEKKNKKKRESLLKQLILKAESNEAKIKSINNIDFIDKQNFKNKIEPSHECIFVTKSGEERTLKVSTIVYTESKMISKNEVKKQTRQKKKQINYNIELKKIADNSKAVIIGIIKKGTENLENFTLDIDIDRDDKCRYITQTKKEEQRGVRFIIESKSMNTKSERDEITISNNSLLHNWRQELHKIVIKHELEDVEIKIDNEYKPLSKIILNQDIVKYDNLCKYKCKSIIQSEGIMVRSVIHKFEKIENRKNNEKEEYDVDKEKQALKNLGLEGYKTAREILNECINNDKTLINHKFLINYMTIDEILKSNINVNQEFKLLNSENIKNKWNNKRCFSESEILFIFKEKHGDKFKYNLSQMIQPNSKVINKCHQIPIQCSCCSKTFEQSITFHINKGKCPNCEYDSRFKSVDFYLNELSKRENSIESNIKKIENINNPDNKKLQEELFETNILKNNKDFSKINLNNNDSKVICNIGCKCHEDMGYPSVYYNQLRSNLVKGKDGCRLCKPKKCGIQHVLLQIKLKHGNKFKYDLHEIMNNDEKTKKILPDDEVDINKMINIYCPHHGIFTQNLQSHKNVQSCQQCKININMKNRKENNADDFKKKFSIINHKKHNNTLTLIGKYESAFVRISVHCSICKKISNITPCKLRQGVGCLNCNGRGSLGKTGKDWLEDILKKYPDQFYYNPEDFNECIWDKKITIFCRKCKKIFVKTLNSHLRTNGCSKCSLAGVSKEQINCLDYIAKVTNQKIIHAKNSTLGEYKIPGVGKVDGFCEETKDVFEYHGAFYHADPSDNNYKSDNVHPLHIKTGKTYQEVYKDSCEKDHNIRNAGYNLIVIWSHAWDNIRTCIYNKDSLGIIDILKNIGINSENINSAELLNLPGI